MNEHAHRIDQNARHVLARLAALRRPLSRDELRLEQAYRDYLERKEIATR
jgi:hypothetical protein